MLLGLTEARLILIAPLTDHPNGTQERAGEPGAVTDHKRNSRTTSQNHVPLSAFHLQVVVCTRSETVGVYGSASKEGISPSRPYTPVGQGWVWLARRLTPPRQPKAIIRQRGNGPPGFCQYYFIRPINDEPTSPRHTSRQATTARLSTSLTVLIRIGKGTLSATRHSQLGVPDCLHYNGSIPHARARSTSFFAFSPTLLHQAALRCIAPSGGFERQKRTGIPLSLANASNAGKFT